MGATATFYVFLATSGLSIKYGYNQILSSIDHNASS